MKKFWDLKFGRLKICLSHWWWFLTRNVLFRASGEQLG